METPKSLPPADSGVTQQGVNNPSDGDNDGGYKKPPSQPSGCVGAPEAAGGEVVSVDERGRK